MARYIFFWKQNEPNGIFSQWYPSIFVEDGIKFINAEQYMMYQKAILFNDEEVAALILKAKDPKTIKALGRKVKNFNEDIWVNNRERIVLQGTYLKFIQNEQLRKFLLKCPEKAIFVEASPLDKIWGIGYASSNALSNKERWGLNLLGKAIGEVRVLLKNMAK